MYKKVALMINSMSGGGAEKLVLTLLEQLQNDGYIIDLICLERDNVYNVNKNIRVTYLTEWDNNVSGIKKLLFLPILAFKLSRYIKKDKVEIVQSHLFRSNYINILSKLFFRARHQVQIVNHSIISRYEKEGIIGKVNLFLIKHLYPFSDKIISVSNVVQKDMQELFSFNNQRKVIYNMFDIGKIQKLSNEEIDNFKFDRNKKYLISIGRLIPLKRNKDLIYVISKLNNNTELIFIGEGKEKEDLINLAHKLNVLERVNFLGWLNNPYPYIKKSNILICTSETESFGNVVVEAMACGTPVISTSCGGPEEIIKNQFNGSLVDIGDIDTMVKNIEKFLTEDTLHKKYIQNSYESCRKFDIKFITKKYKKVLELD